MEQTIRRTFAALNATNEAILYAKSPEELYAKVCEAAFSSGDFLATAVFLLDAETSRLRFAAGFGADIARLRGIDISIIANTPEGDGVCGQAFRDQKACVSNDYLNDPRSLAWRAGARSSEVAAAAAMPLICNGRSAGVFLVTRREIGSLGNELVSLLARMAANVSFALDNFEHERMRKSSERAMRRLNQMFGAISATNEAILRAKTEHDLYQRVCDAAVHSGKSVAAVVLLAEPDTHWLEPVAGTGDAIDLITQTRFSTDPDNIYGKGICGQAFRAQRPCINNDIPTSDGPWREVGRDTGVMACIAVPLTKFGKSVGVLMFFVGRSWATDEEIVALMARIAENVSVALDNFERANEKARADRQKDRLSRMFAALSATNEAIMRARSREEMFVLVCQAAGKGARFNSTSIFLVTPGSDYFEMATTAGPTAENARNLKVSINEAIPEGRGLCGTAFRSRQASISNNFLKDIEGSAFRDIIEREGARSGAAFPLFVDGEPVGVMLFIASERDTFTAEFCELLQRLADNVSFALGGFERADEKARTEEQKERLTRMFAALSATNEAIMRAKSRTELFHLVCEAAVVGGNFTSTAIALERPGDDYLENIASAGPDRERAFSVRLSINPAHPEGRSLTGIAFRTRKPCISNDYLGDFGVSSPFYEVLRDAGTRSGAAFPLLKNGKPIGAVIFLSSEIGAFSPELIGLLRRLAENVSFALENFDRADEKARADERIEYLASHDGLTRLPNRETFNELLRHAIEVAGRHQRQFALLFIDLDRFKVINDSLGHDAGDLLLVKIADRLRGTLRSSDVIARLGGDEFVVILEETDRADVETIAESLLSALRQPLQLSGHECHTTASIGIAMYPDDGSDAKTLTKNADMAMYLAKEDGKNGFRFHSKEIKAQSIERLTLENALRRALERDQFSLCYQPKIDIASGQITGVEALLRWTHPDLGQIVPAQFIPLAEEIGLIVPIGRWVLKEACTQNMAWQRRGLRPVTMAVNLSPRQFADEHLLHDVDEALRSSGMSPALLQLEVTESMVMRNVSRAVRVLDAIQSRGIRLAIDDFGTGYSSMSLMKQFPIDTIKIDRSFVRDLARDSEDQAIAQAIISMGKALGMTVIAEGVETAEQERFLRDHGCDEMQGFLLSKPLPPRELAELLRSAPALASPPLQPADGAADDQAALDSRRKRAVI